MGLQFFGAPPAAMALSAAQDDLLFFVYREDCQVGAHALAHPYITHTLGAKPSQCAVRASLTQTPKKHTRNQKDTIHLHYMVVNARYARNP